MIQMQGGVFGAVTGVATLLAMTLPVIGITGGLQVVHADYDDDGDLDMALTDEIADVILLNKTDFIFTMKFHMNQMQSSFP